MPDIQLANRIHLIPRIIIHELFGKDLFGDVWIKFELQSGVHRVRSFEIFVNLRGFELLANSRSFKMDETIPFNDGITTSKMIISRDRQEMEIVTYPHGKLLKTFQDFSRSTEPVGQTR